jgi:hypothetical protein
VTNDPLLAPSGINGTADVSSVKLLVLAALGFIHAAGAHRKFDAYNAFGVPHIFDRLDDARVDPRVRDLVQGLDELPAVKALCGKTAWASAVFRLEKIGLDLLEELGRAPPRAQSPMLLLLENSVGNSHSTGVS